MQNFTLGKRGMTIFLFALILLIGSSPSYAQQTPDNCPTIANTPSSAFCYMDDLQDLTDITGASVSNGEVAWYRAATGGNPIPAGEFLQSGDYYLGNTDGSCTSRLKVATTVTTLDAPIPISDDTNFSPSVSSMDPADGYTITDLLKIINTSDPSNADLTLVVFKTEYGADTYGPTDNLVDGKSYFIGQQKTGNPCPSLRIAISYTPLLVNAPNAKSPQLVCEGATAADLVATGTSQNTKAFRWYSTATSNPEYDKELKDGETYYVSQIVNNREDAFPPEESKARTPVTVNFTSADAGSDNSADICILDVEDTFPDFPAIEAYLFGLLDNGVDQTGTFSPTAQQLADDYNSKSDKTGTYTTTYTVGDGDCEDSAELTINVIPSVDANAGTIDDFAVCSFDPIVLFSKLSSDATTGGDFYDKNDNIITNGEFTPTATGDYEITYKVDDSSGCITGSDAAAFTVSVGEGDANAGNDNSSEICVLDVEDTFPDFPAIETYLLGLLDDDADKTGTFNPTAKELSKEYNTGNKVGTYTTTYTVNDGVCEDSVQLTVNVTDSEDANAGTIDDFAVCSFDPIVLFSKLSSDATTGGDFYDKNNNIITNGEFTPTATGDYEITYKVDDSSGCITGSDAAAFTISVGEGDADAGNDNSKDICILDVDDMFPDFPAIEDYLLDLLDDGVDKTGTFNPTAKELSKEYNTGNKIGTYTTTYTVNDGVCEDSVQLTVNVTDSEDANAGTIDDFSVCSFDPIDLSNKLSSDAMTTGTFSDADGKVLTSNEFTPTALGEYEITYTVDGTSGCIKGTDSAKFTITVGEGDANAGSDNSTEICILDVDDMFPDFPAIETYLFGLLDDDADKSGTFNPTAKELSKEYNSGNKIGTYTTTYTVNDGTCEDSAKLTVTVVDSEDANAGTIDDFEVCGFDPIDLFSKLSSDAIATGTFSNADGKEITNGEFEPDAAGNYKITYTVNADSSCVEGTDAVTFIIAVEEGGNAGEDTTIELCVAQVDEFKNDPAAGIAFLKTIISDDVDKDGEFSPKLEVLLGQILANPLGTYSSTYTIGEGACQDSAVYTLNITETGGMDAGEDQKEEVCIIDIDQMFPNVNSVENYINNMIPDGIAKDGTFSKTTQELVDEYNARGDRLGDYTFNYTVSDGTCSDTSEYTITVTDVTDANAGDDQALTFCATETDIDLFDYLDANASPNGVFDGYVDGKFDPSAATEEVVTIKYVVDEDSSNNSCISGSDEADYVITIQQPEAANAGDDVTAQFCIGQDEDIDLFGLLSEGANTNGTFSTPYESGAFNPATAGEGTYEVIYTVEEAVEGACVIGADSATLTLEVGNFAEAPEVNDVTFCAADGATVADLGLEGMTVYTDDALTTPAFETDVLEAGAYYVTQTSSGGCESQAAVLTVTLDDVPMPTLKADGDIFCDFDHPTLRELQDNIVEEGTITWYDAATEGNVLNTSDALRNGTTYYAGISDGTCESSERLAITVSLEDCPVVIPEAFSPNGDGINDRFEVRHIAEEYPNFTMEIFNRWGDVVFKGNASTPDWDGTSSESGFGNKVLPVGVYFYILNYNDGQTAPTQGRVYLSR